MIGHTPGVAGGGWEEEMEETCDTSRMCDATSIRDMDDTPNEAGRWVGERCHLDF